MSDKIQVIVNYVGHTGFQDSFPGGETFKAIKLAAMKFFELEESAAFKYALQYNGVDLKENGHLSSLNANPVTLTLVLTEEVNKGTQ